MSKMTVLEARTALGVKTRYALAKRLGVTPSAANQWRRKGATKRNDRLDPLPELRALQVEKMVREEGRKG